MAEELSHFITFVRLLSLIGLELLPAICIGNIRMKLLEQTSLVNKILMTIFCVVVEKYFDMFEIMKCL